MTKNNETLNLIEIYPSIQGETSFVGLPTCFIRLSGCNLRCSWCDSEYTFKGGKTYAIDAIISKIENFGLKHICITGGEPLLQKNLPVLIKSLCDLDYLVTIETSGSITTENIDARAILILDIKCPASGMSEKNLLQNLEILRTHDEVKFVIQDKKDYLFAVEICKKYGLFSRKNMVLFSCVHDVMEPRVLVNWILKDKIPARLNLQIHKLIWSPNKKGV